MKKSNKKKESNESPKGEVTVATYLSGYSFFIGIVQNIISACILAVIAFFIGLPGQINDMSSDLKSINEKLEDINSRDGLAGRIDDLSDDIDDLEDKVGNLSNYDGKVGKNKYKFNINIKSTDYNLKPIEGRGCVAYSIGSDQSDGEIFEQTNFVDDSYIFVEKGSLSKLTKDDIRGKTILYSYELEIDGVVQNTVFYGQYDDDLNWQGRCIINKYNDGCLDEITDAIYEHGEMIKYQQLFAGDTEGTWWAGYRERMKGYDTGQTIKFEKTNDIMAGFDFDDIDINDIRTVADTIDQNNLRLCTFYEGNTSGGTSNDDTGKAYFVSFDEEMNVLTLYSGGFTDGKFNDLTGEAWEIARENRKGSKYIYYSGRFDMGKRTDTIDKGEKEEGNPRDIDTLKEIKRIIRDHHINISRDIDLKWAPDAF